MHSHDDQHLVTGNTLNCFKAYLSDRMQTININATLSDFKNVDIGILQGSILCPLLFIIHANSAIMIVLNQHNH